MFVGGGREGERGGGSGEKRDESADGRTEGKTEETPKGATATSVGKGKEQILLAQRREEAAIS